MITAAVFVACATCMLHMHAAHAAKIGHNIHALTVFWLQNVLRNLKQIFFMMGTSVQIICRQYPYNPHNHFKVVLQRSPFSS